MFNDIESFLAFITNKKASNKKHKGDFALVVDKLGNPQQYLRCLHVAGTNGKGSVTNYLRSILQTAGYKVGTFTSPHLIKHNDRIRIDDVYISDADLLAIGNELIDYWYDYDLSMFEIDMIISLIYFQRNNVDYVVYEVGMGGRLDPTNIITPLVSVIVTIGFDHMQYLGDTLDKIAYEKAGIIKDNGLVFTAEDKPICLEVFEQTAAERHARLYKVVTDVPYTIDDHITFAYGDYPQITIPTIAGYQVKNAILALEVCDQLRQQGIISMRRQDIIDGLATAFWKGRFEIVRKAPLVVIDGAHNEHGVRALADSVAVLPKPLRIVFSALKDKQYHEMIATLKQYTDELIVTEFTNQRSTSAEELAKGLPVTVISDYRQAIATAIAADQAGSVLITGSLYFVSIVREMFKGVD